MNKKVTTQYFLHEILDASKRILFSSDEKEKVFQFFEKYQNQFLNTQFEVSRVTTITESEVVASSKDPRQAIFNF